MKPHLKATGKIRNETEMHKEQKEFILGGVLPPCLRQTWGLCVEFTVFHTSRWNSMSRVRWPCIPWRQLFSLCLNIFSIPTLTLCHCWPEPMTPEVLTKFCPSNICLLFTLCFWTSHSPLQQPTSLVDSDSLFQSKPFTLFLWGSPLCRHFGF